ncbi:hypothetical protein TVAG_117030 [Trichomonas vaginalis G3]|uniref:Dynein regulatory complex protein 1 C-terminal domain-containing protein n=1 Tax=Trichomonas vaginalis (strain ATCC PRA-98 / G3) TaxID=412133 RepID=A2E3P3_TRIV3|nr:NYD-SP28 protein family [Trichomonas vaginalis G3]EAY12681.1 hypothetical protein TVAG_117030 [Trichomonas vaginalis G3]KAI5517557.1 NYD-SP28 protein family [Trichomonas vaginalis G3]|eukprot:XP_001324904.1 hypothetical protein [Trichomonas vaginalis G3]
MSNLLALDQPDRAPIEQINKSKEIINKLFANSAQNLSNMVNKQTQIEQERAQIVKASKKKFGLDYAELQKKTHSEMEEAGEVWESLLNISMPLELKQQLEEQKARCDAIVQEKLEFIHKMEEDVLMRDHEYVNKVAAQKALIDEFVHTMRNQENNIKKTINSEIKKILGAYNQEVTSRSYQLDREIKNLSAKRQERETTLMNDILELNISHRDQLETIRQQNNEKYMQIRTALEKKLQIAQEEQEDRKAQYIYSLTQLDYDYKILQETRDEHQNKLKLQNDKKSRQRDVLIKLQERYESEKRKLIDVNMQITKEYTRIASSYRELQSRFRNVAYTDFNNFREVWNLNEKRLHDIVLKIISADNIVMEQQLGKDPNPVDPEYLRRWIIESDEYEDLTKTPQLPTQKDNGESNKLTNTIFTKPELSENLEHLRRMICDEVGFIVDELVRNIIGLDPNVSLDEDSQCIKMDALFKELGVSTDEDIETLMSYFIKEPEFNQLEHPDTVSPHEVISALRAFVDAYHPNKQQAQMNIFKQIVNDATQNTSSEVARGIMQLQVKMKKQLPAQRRFWEKKAEIVSEDMWRLWNMTFKGMQRYYEVLENRAKLIQETSDLRRQNEELSVILQNYIDTKDDTNLIYPPCDTVGFFD